MLDIQSLERRWLRYKLKAYLPYAILVTVSLFGFGVYSMFFSPVSEPETPVRSSSLTPVVKALQPQPSSLTQEVVLEPSMAFMETIAVPTPVASAVTPPAQKELPPRPPVAAHTPLPKETVFASPAIPKEPITAKSPTNEKKGAVPIVKRDDAPLNINELQTRFQTSSNPNLGVFIARYHYDHGNYPEAYNYALKTNAINNKMEESWIIFAKSLIKMGKMDQAKKTLQLYISQSNSENAKALLDSLDKDIKK